MPTPLARLLDDIHPERTREKLVRQADDALVSFPIMANLVPDAIRYREILCRFIQHLDHHLEIVPSCVYLTPDSLWRRALQLVREVFGDHGEQAAFELVRSGAEGGLYGVLQAVAAHAARAQSDRDVSTRVDRFCQRLSAEEYLAVGQEYLQQHGHLLPREMLEGFAGRARINLAELLKRHHRALVALNEVGRR